MRHALFGDEALVSRVEHNDRAVGVRVVDPHLQLLGGEHRARGVVRAAQVDDVRTALGKRRAEAVFSGGGHVGDVRPALGFGIVVARAARHRVGVDVDGVYRVANGDDVVDIKDVADVAAVRLGAIGDEDLVVGDVDPACVEVLLRDDRSQEIVALLRAVAMEGLGASHVVDGGVHRLDDGRCERARHVADAHLDELRLGVRLGICGRATGDLGEEIAAREFLIVRIDLSHESAPCRFVSCMRRMPHRAGPTSCPRFCVAPHCAAD